MARKKATKATAESPTSSCLLICDEVTLGIGRDRHTLHGVVNVITVDEKPAKVGPFVAYVRLSNVYPSQKIELKFCTAGEDEVFRMDAEAPKTSDPLGVHTLILVIPQFTVEAGGRYIFSVSHGGVPFATSPIQVVVFDEKDES